MALSNRSIRLVRMRCRDCPSRWARTLEASRGCPFCGSDATLAGEDVLRAISRRTVESPHSER